MSESGYGGASSYLKEDVEMFSEDVASLDEELDEEVGISTFYRYNWKREMDE